MGKYTINDLCLEVTRRCNLNCDHCLRGCQENKDMDNSIIDTLLSNVDYISHVTFTGGEPLLNPSTIIYFINEVKRLNIAVGSFYMVTNGLVFDKELFFSLLEFYQYVEDDDKEYGMTSISVSIDDYHDNSRSEYLDYWKSLVFYRGDKDQSDNTSFNNNLISEGNAQELGIGSRPLTLDGTIEIYDNTIETMFYVNVDGEILNNCDMSYETQTFNVMGTVEEFDTFIEEYTEVEEIA